MPEVLLFVFFPHSMLVPAVDTKEQTDLHAGMHPIPLYGWTFMIY